MYTWYDADRESGPWNAHSSEFVRDERYKLYRVYRCTLQWTFFDLGTDPFEEHPIANYRSASAAHRSAWDRLAPIFAQEKSAQAAMPGSCP
jgi:hypothetical protein